MRRILLLFIIVASGYLSFSQAAKRTFDLDHIIIWTEKDAPELKLFEEKGFPIASRGFLLTGLVQKAATSVSTTSYRNFCTPTKTQPLTQTLIEHSWRKELTDVKQANHLSASVCP